MPELMTKKDAIEYLLYMKHEVQAKSPMDIALDTAIEALKQTTIQKSTGMRLIDANALHEKILEENRRNYAATENVAQILLRIETAPTIEAEPVKLCKVREQCTDIVCENCGKEYSAELLFMARSGKESGYYWFKRCPSCGAYWEWEE